MKISQFKSALQLAKPTDNPQFLQSNGVPVSAHYHITEIGLILKNYVDCGGVVRQERKASMQLWLANDTSQKLRRLRWGGAPRAQGLHATLVS
jgi:N-acetyl-anhydromuramyl-L-alanine amidase AmpD